MVRGLLVLNSSINGSRDLWWPLDQHAKRGYNIYRAQDAPANWQKLNTTPVPGQFFRDETKLQTIRYVVPPTAWADAGEFGMRVLTLPDIPYSNAVKGRPVVAAHPDDIHIEYTDAAGVITQGRAAIVSGIDQTVFLQRGLSLPTGGAVSDFPAVDFDNVATVTVTYRKLTNFVDIITNMTRTFYTVVPVSDRGEEHAPGAFGTDIVDNMQVDRIDYMYRRMVEYNAWLFEQVGEPVHLMFRRTSGEGCGCTGSSDFTQGRTACPVCFETGIVGGYYGPIDMLFIDPDVAAIHTVDEGGRKVERKSKTYLSRTPIVQDGDMIVRRNGERLVISGVTYKMPRGVLLQQDFDVALLPPKDTRYLIPLFEPEIPILFNPAVTRDPGHGAEPVYSDETNPHKHNENPDNSRTGRTVTFGRIGARGGPF
jgi:hypothetical protein